MSAMRRYRCYQPQRENVSISSERVKKTEMIGKIKRIVDTRCTFNADDPPAQTDLMHRWISSREFSLHLSRNWPICRRLHSPAAEAFARQTVHLDASGRCAARALDTRGLYNGYGVRKVRDTIKYERVI